MSFRAKSRRLENLKIMLRQFRARRAEFGQWAFWLKAFRILFRAGQSCLWPRWLLRRILKIFEQRPWTLHIEPTNVCQASCVFCAYQYQTRRKLPMPMVTFKKALEQYVAMGGGDLMIECVVGDPLLDPRFLDKVRMARARPEIVAIRTISNLIALDRVGADAFVRSGVSSILVSTAGFDKESYLRLYRSHLYERMKNNVLALLKANRDAGGPVQVTIGFRTDRPLRDVLSDPDYQEVKAYHPDVDFTYAFSDWQGTVVLGANFVRREPPVQEESCYNLYDGPMVFANGDLGLCACQDVDADSELIVGNIAEQSLLEIWTSPKVAELRRRFSAGNKPDLCRNCAAYQNMAALRTFSGLRRAQSTKDRLKASLVQ